MIESGEPLFFTANRSNSKKSLSAVWAGNIGDAFVVGIIALLAFDVSAVPTAYFEPPADHSQEMKRGAIETSNRSAFETHAKSGFSTYMDNKFMLSAFCGAVVGAVVLVLLRLCASLLRNHCCRQTASHAPIYEIAVDESSNHQHQDTVGERISRALERLPVLPYSVLAPSPSNDKSHDAIAKGTITVLNAITRSPLVLPVAFVEKYYRHRATDASSSKCVNSEGNWIATSAREQPMQPCRIFGHLVHSTPATARTHATIDTTPPRHQCPQGTVDPVGTTTAHGNAHCCHPHADDDDTAPLLPTRRHDNQRCTHAHAWDSGCPSTLQCRTNPDGCAGGRSAEANALYSLGDAREEDTCAVCLEDLRPAARVRVLPCMHYFHAACVDPWLRTRPTCPLCVDTLLDSP
eukprot:m.215525 g.215525  ORF g.215525 m.215525 type:complete len:406 (-) comp19100_c0_seq2:52-1269(-)